VRISSSISSDRGRQTVAVDDLEAGMILVESVHDSQGRLLIQQGTELTGRHLRAFQLWGILSVRVRGPEGEESDPAPISAAILAAAEAGIRPRFRQNDIGHPLIAVLLHGAILREARRLADLERGRA
jgi:hypothetical protein